MMKENVSNFNDTDLKAAQGLPVIGVNVQAHTKI